MEPCAARSRGNPHPPPWVQSSRPIEKGNLNVEISSSLWADSNQLTVGSLGWGLRGCEPHKVLHNECSAHTRSALLQHQATSARREGTTFTFRCLDYLLLSPQGIFKFAASLHHSIVGALTSQDLRRARHRRSQRQSLFGEPTIEKWTPLIINARTQIQLVLELHAAWTCT